MIYSSITLDVYCDNSDQNPVYRLYVDNDLLTERTWTWHSYEVFIRENIEIETPAGQHQIRVEKVSGPGNFITKNLTFNGVALDSQDLTFDVAP